MPLHILTTKTIHQKIIVINNYVRLTLKAYLTRMLKLNSFTDHKLSMWL